MLQVYSSYSLCVRGIETSKGMIYFSQTPNKSGHSFATVNSSSLNIYVLVKRNKNVVTFFTRTIQKKKKHIMFDLPLFTVLVSPSFPSIFVLLFSFRSRLISRLLLLSALFPRFRSSSGLLLFSNELSSDCFDSEFSFSSVVQKFNGIKYGIKTI